MAALRPRRRIGALAVWLAATACATQVSAQTNPELEQLKKEIVELRRRDVERQKQLDELQRRLDRLLQPVGAKEAPPAAAAAIPAPAKDEANAALDRELETVTGTPAASSDLWSKPVGGTKLRLLDVSFNTLLAAGTSTVRDADIEHLQAGGHDPQRRGFTLQQAELSFAGAVDSYLLGEAHIVYAPNVVELEEAFLTTSSLPYGLQMEAGYFLTEFGLINPLHPHSWDWIDQPVVNSRMFGGDGLRSPGLRLAWLTPLPWFSELHFGTQNANEDETTTSFVAEEAVGGRATVDRSVRNLGDFLYLARWENFTDVSDTVGIKLGLSGLHGPNNTGSDGETWIYGADLKVRWRPRDNFRGWPFFIWQSEGIKRDYNASPFVRDEPESVVLASLRPRTLGEGDGDPNDVEVPEMLDSDTLHDWGFYTQALYGFRHGWASGLRFEYAGGSGASIRGRNQDPLRDTRFRLSPLLVWQPSEFSRLRLQYNYDDARHLGSRDAHSFWLGAEILYGMHPAHKY